MRGFATSLTCLLLMAGFALAAEVTLIRYDGEKKAVTVKEGAAEKTYTVTDKTKVTFIDKDGRVKEGTLEAATKILGSAKAAGKLKFDITTNKGDVTELKMTARRGK